MLPPLVPCEKGAVAAGFPLLPPWDFATDDSKVRQAATLASRTFLQIQMEDQGAGRRGIRGIQRCHGLAGLGFGIQAERDGDIQLGGSATTCPFHLSGADGFRKQVIPFLGAFDFSLENATVFVVVWSQEILHVEFGLLFCGKFRKTPVIDLVDAD